MRLKLKNTPEQIELVKALGSRNANASREAQEAFAAFLGPVIQEVLNVAGTASTIYTNSEFDEDDVSLYWKGYDENLQDFVVKTCQNIASMKGGSGLEPHFDEAKDWVFRYLLGSTMSKSYRQALDLLPKIHSSSHNLSHVIVCNDAELGDPKIAHGNTLKIKSNYSKVALVTEEKNDMAECALDLI